MTLHAIYISPANGDAFRYVAMRSPKDNPKLLWFLVPADMRQREHHIDPRHVPAGIKERAYDMLGGRQ